jgi:divergent DnaB-like ATPase
MADEKLNVSLQENLITILCHSDKVGKVVANLALPEMFTGEYRVIAERAIEYWRKHKKAPGPAHTSDILSDILDDPNNRKARTYRTLIRNMLQLSEEVNTEYVVDQLRRRSRTTRMMDAILKGAETLNANPDRGLEDVEQLMSDILRTRDIGFDRGIDLLDVDHIINYLERHSSEFRTGIKPLDQRNIVPARSAVLLFLAPTGRGKTWFLCHVGKHALLQRKKVVHITLELDAEQTAQRYYQDLFSMAKHDEEVPVTRLRIKDGSFEDVRTIKVRPEMSFDQHTERVRKYLKKEVKLFKPLRNLIIKQFPQRSLDMNGLRAYLDTLEAEGFIPDMVILDYIGITKTDVKNPRSTLGRAFEDFRAICQERKIAGVTAHQVSKLGMDAEMVRSTHVAEDVSLIFTADVSLTYSSTPAEEKLNLARIFVAKARSEADKFGVLITQNYKLGQFVLQSHLLDPAYAQYLRALGAEEDSDDDDEEEARPRKRRDRSRDR